VAVVDIDADIVALKLFREAVDRYRYEQRNVADNADHEIELTRASLEAKTERWRIRLEDRRRELDRCLRRAAAAAAEGRHVDCSSWAAAVQEAEERLTHIRRWQHRVEQEVAAFRGTAGRFRDLLEGDLRRAETHLRDVISGLEAARRLQAPEA